MKKLSQKGIAHHLLIVGIAVLVVAAVGFAGFRVYKGKNDTNAKAAGWTVTKIGDAGWIYACQSRYGTGYKLQAKVYYNYANWGLGSTYFSKPPVTGLSSSLGNFNFSGSTKNTWSATKSIFVSRAAYTSNWAGDARLVTNCF